MITGNSARSWGRRLLAAALITGLAGAATSAAGATIGISGGTLIAGAEPGDDPMTLTAFAPGPDLVLLGFDFAVVTPGCTASAGSVSCALSGFTSLVIIGSDGDDTITLSPLTGHAFAITVLGRDGNDVILGSSGNDALFGGAGDDNVFGEGGADLLSGGTGNDLVFFDDDDLPAGPEPAFEPLPAASAAAPGVLALIAAAFGALGVARRKTPHRGPHALA